MSVLEKIRKRTWLVLVFILGALLLFVIQEAITNAISATSDDPNEIAVIGDEKVTRNELAYQNNFLKQQYSVNQQGKQPDAQTAKQFETQAWERVIFEKAYKNEFEKLGIEITENDPTSEKIDMIQGSTPHPTMVQYFQDEEGNFDPEKVKSFLNNMENADPKNEQAQYQKASYAYLEFSLLEDRLRQKYMDLLSKSNYITTAEANRNYTESKKTASFNYLYVPYYAIADSSVEVSDAELQEYLDKNKKKFAPAVESKTFEYIVFSTDATAEDSSEILSKITKEVDLMTSSDDDNTYFQTVAADDSEFKTVKYIDLPYQLKADSSSMEKGKVYGPLIDGQSYKAYKIVDIIDSDTLYKATASHILISADTSMSDSLFAAKRAKADSLLAVAKNTDDFASLATKYSEGPSASKGGDLGEFESGMMVKPFQDAVFSRNKEGVVPQVIKTQFGFHIINVTKAKEKADSKYVFGTVQFDIEPSDITRDSVYERVETVFTNIDRLEDLQKLAEENDDIELLTAQSITADAQSIGVINNTKDVIRWAFTEGEIGEVFEEIKEEGNQYAIFAYKASVSPDDVSLDAVRERVKAEVLKAKKGEMVLDAIAKTNGTLEERKAALEKTFPTVRYDQSQTTLSSNSAGNAGYDPQMVGAVFALEEGKNSGPQKGENGVYIVEVTKVTPADEKEDYKEEKEKMLQSKQYAERRLVDKAIKEAYEIKDMRYKY